MKKLPAIFTVLAIFCVFGLQLLYGNKPPFSANRPAPSPTVRIENTTPSPSITYSFVVDTPGQTALELLESKAQIEYQTKQSGVVITSINDKKIDDSHAWLLYVNDVEASRSADKLTVSTGDEVSFVYSEVPH